MYMKFHKDLTYNKNIFQELYRPLNNSPSWTKFTFSKYNRNQKFSFRRVGERSSVLFLHQTQGLSPIQCRQNPRFERHASLDC